MLTAPHSSADQAAPAALDEAERLRIARQVERVVAARVYARLREHAAQASAEYRFRDFMDRHVLALVLVFLLAAALTFGLGELAVRNAGRAAAQYTRTVAWLGWLLFLPACLSVAVLYLRRRVMGARWWQGEPAPLPRRTALGRRRGTAVLGGLVTLFACLAGWFSPLLLLVSLDCGFVGLIAFVVYSELG
jgi:hypothetical protein